MENQCLFLEISQEWTGLCNQLLTFLGTLTKTVDEKSCKIIVVDKFLNEIHKPSYSSISDVLDLPDLNYYLLQNGYNVYIADGTRTTDFRIMNANYGTGDTNVDVTNEIIARFFSNEELKIERSFNLNEAFGDPCLGEKKRLEIVFHLHKDPFILYFNEFSGSLKEDVYISFKEKEYRFLPYWSYLKESQYDIFTNGICKSLKFNESLHRVSNDFIKNVVQIDDSDEINVIHLRLEDDAIRHWSVLNNMDELSFKNKIVEIYKTFIERSISKSSKSIILTYSTDNDVINYLKTNDYKYYICEKNLQIGREINAVVDLINSKSCNSTFIGVKSSTFTEIIEKMIVFKKKEMFDIENIHA